MAKVQVTNDLTIARVEFKGGDYLKIQSTAYETEVAVDYAEIDDLIAALQAEKAQRALARLEALVESNE